MTRSEELHLVALAQAGDRDAADRLVHRWHRMVWKLALAYHGRCARISSEDFAQVGWVGFWRCVLAFRPTFGRLSSYAITSAKRAMENEYRAATTQKRSREFVGFDLSDEYRIDPVDHREPSLTTEELGRSQLRACHYYRMMTPRQRQAMRLLSSGKTNKQVAEVLGVTHQTITSLRNRVKQRILRSNPTRSA